MTLPAACSFLALAEFDVDHGNCLTDIQPETSLLAQQADQIADKMLCDGAEKHPLLTTWFTLTHEEGLMYCLNCVKTYKDTAARRGAVTRAACIGTAHPWLMGCLHQVVLALVEVTNTEAIDLVALHHALCEGIHIPLIDMSPALRLRRRLFNEEGSQTVVVRLPPGVFANNQVTLDIPIGMPLEEITFPTSFIAPSTWRELLLPAILHDMRVLFVSSNTSNAEFVGAAVLAAANWVTTSLSVGNYVKDRVFPYCSLLTMQSDVLKTDHKGGYIMGVTNPVFRDKTSWWDVAVDVDTHEVTFASTWCWPQQDPMLPSVTHIFYNLIYVDDSELAHNYREVQATQLFQRWRGQADTLFGRTWHQLCFGTFQEDQLVMTLQSLLKALRTESDVISFLFHFERAEEGAIAPLAVCIFHPAQVVRLLTTALLRRFDESPVGQKCISDLNHFLMLAYERNKRTMPETTQ